MIYNKMKKKIALLACLLAGSKFVHAQEAYTIEGTVKSMPASKTVTVNLYYLSATKQFVRDSCDVVNGHFSFKGEAPIPLQAFLSMTDDHENFQHAFPAFGGKHVMVQIGMFLEKGKLTAVLDHAHQEDAIITGSMNNDAFQAFRPIMNKYKKMEAGLVAKSNAAGDTQNDAIIKEFAAMNTERTKALGEVIKKYPSALSDFEFLNRWVKPADNFASAKLFYSYLSPELQNSFKGKKFADAIKAASTVEINAIAPEFSLADTAGKIQKLSNYKGKYVLVDFWASWCVPCRKETPNLINAYQQYKNKNFEIVSISLDGGKDDSRQQWLKAIKQDKMTWPQLSDLQGFTSSVAQMYTISAIPMNFLIDPTGKIIARNLRGDELKEALSKFL
jgi:thiol-disulfide isomerase/thioredoxin